MINAMIKNLEEGGLQVFFSEPDLKKIGALKGEDIKNVVFYLDADLEEMKKILIYMKDLLQEMNSMLHVYLVGNPDELHEAGEYFPFDYSAQAFERPLNVKELVEAISEAEQKGEEGTDGKKRILVVDDDGTMLRTLKLWLSDRYRVYMANSGLNAISLLARNPVDLILLDYEMPVASGPQVLEMLRNDPVTREIPVMFLTAKNDKESIMRVMDLKPERYLLKTMPPDELLKSISDFFEKQGR